MAKADPRAFAAECMLPGRLRTGLTIIVPGPVVPRSFIIEFVRLERP